MCVIRILRLGLRSGVIEWNGRECAMWSVHRRNIEATELVLGEYPSLSVRGMSGQQHRRGISDSFLLAV